MRRLLLRIAKSGALLALLASTMVGCGAATDLPDGTPFVADAGGTARDSGGGDAGSAAFPIGAYTECAEGTHNGDSNDFLDSVGFVSGAVLTVMQSGDGLAATYVDEGGNVRSYTFTKTTSTSASLASAGETESGFFGLCVQGPGDEGGFAATMTATTGTLTYDEGTVFLTLDGTIQGDGGPCGAESTHSSDWIVCGARQGGAPSPEPTVPASTTAQLPVGQYACASQIGTYDVVGAEMEFITTGDSGTLSLKQSGVEVVAEYAGDPQLTGTLNLTATTATTAIAETNQSVMTPCAAPIATLGTTGSTIPYSLPVDAGSLAVDGSTLFVSFTGTMDARSTCEGAQMAVTLVCALQ